MMKRLSELTETEPKEEWCYRADIFVNEAFEACAIENDICSILTAEQSTILRIFKNR